jgi:uncharacterized membrane protein
MNGLNRITKLLLGSASLNVFLIGFIVGHHGGPRPCDMMFHGPGLGPPPFLAGMHADGRLGAGPEPGAPPPFFGPDDVFHPQDMKDNLASLQKNFDQIGYLRKEFAEKLKQGGVTKVDVLAHFATIDKIMDDLKQQMQDKAATRISTMSPDEREHLANRLLEAPGPGPEGVGPPPGLSPQGEIPPGGGPSGGRTPPAY